LTALRDLSVSFLHDSPHNILRDWVVLNKNPSFEEHTSSGLHAILNYIETSGFAGFSIVFSCKSIENSSIFNLKKKHQKSKNSSKTRKIR